MVVHCNKFEAGLALVIHPRNIVGDKDSKDKVTTGIDSDSDDEETDNYSSKFDSDELDVDSKGLKTRIEI